MARCTGWVRGGAAVALLSIVGCGGGGSGGTGVYGSTSRAAYVGDYAGFLAVAAASGNQLVPGDQITVANDWGGYWFGVGSPVSNVRITITGAAGSAAGTDGGDLSGGTGGTGTFDLNPAYLTAQSASGFWIVLGEGGRPSAGEVGPLSDYRAYNGGGAATDWSLGEDTYEWAGGGGGGSDVRLVLAGDPLNPHASVDPTAAPTSRFAIVGGGGGGTSNYSPGGAGGGFNLPGGDSVYDDPNYLGYGGTLVGGGDWGGTLARGGDGLMDGTEGWAGGGGGGYYGGGAPQAHGGGGGGSGYLLLAPGIFSVSTSSGAQGGNPGTTTHGSFTLIVD